MPQEPPGAAHSSVPGRPNPGKPGAKPGTGVGAVSASASGAAPLPAKLVTQPTAASASVAKPSTATTKTAAATSTNAATTKAGDAPPGKRPWFNVAESGREGKPRLDLSKLGPPWLISLLAHMSLILALALVVIAPRLRPQIDIGLNYSENIGDQLLDPSMDDLHLEAFDFGGSEAVQESMFSVADSLDPASTEFNPDAAQEALKSSGGPPSIRELLKGRNGERRGGLVSKYGGDGETENAVELALEWLAKNQQKPGGSWSLAGRYADGIRVRGGRDSNEDNRESATAMALLAFQGAGYSHQEGKYAKEISDGWKYLLRVQTELGDGSFYRSGPNSHRQYTNAQCTIALCEIYGMTQDSLFREPASRALRYLEETQAEEGGWKYMPNYQSDMSVTGWVAMALQSGRMAGLEVRGETFVKLSYFLDSVESEIAPHPDGKKNYEIPGVVYRYMENGPTTPALTAEGVLCRMYLGWPRNEPRLQKAMQYLNHFPIQSSNHNVYHWYYATQVMHHYGGETWRDWNANMKPYLLTTQVKEGKERGSWDPKEDYWGAVHGGRLYTTCLCTYMLEVYYRHLPLYDSLLDPTPEPAPKTEAAADMPALPGTQAALNTAPEKVARQ